MNQKDVCLKEWHKSVEPSMRLKIANNIKEAVTKNIFFPSWEMYSSQIKMIDQMEKEIFETSNSRSEYYFNVAQKTYKLYDSINEEIRINEDLKNLSVSEEDIKNTKHHEQIALINDPEKLKLMRQYLISVFNIDLTCSLEDVSCNHFNCVTVINILSHLKTCPNEICNAQFCTASKNIIEHFQNCLNNTCNTCSPILYEQKKEVALM